MLMKEEKKNKKDDPGSILIALVIMFLMSSSVEIFSRACPVLIHWFLEKLKNLIPKIDRGSELAA